MNDATPSEPSVPPIEVEPIQPTKKKLKLPGLLVLIGVPAGLLLLVGGYFLSGYLVAGQIDKNYSAQDCQKVVPLGKVAESIYPQAIMPYLRPALAQFRECQPYVQAVEAQEQGEWETAYTAYATYLQNYPQGIYASQAHESAAQALLSWAKDLEDAQDYAGAVEKLSLLLSDYGNSSVAGKAGESMARALLGWANALVGDQDYETAVEKLTTLLEDYGSTAVVGDARESMAGALLGWAKVLQGQQDYSTAIAKLEIVINDYGDTSAAGEARTLRAQIYFEWAKQQSSQKEFADAEKNYQNAIAMDPDPSATGGPAAQAKAALAQFYLDWGNDDVSKAEFEQALTHFSTAEQYASTELKSDINAARAHCQVAWAKDLSGKEQFNASLTHLDEAGKVPLGDTIDTEISSARTEILDKYSKSSGAEAQQFMKDSAESLCVDRKTAELPILGVNPDEVRVYPIHRSDPHRLFYLSKAVLATTPGNLHYVACVSDNIVYIQGCPYMGGHRLVRQRIDRTVDLINVATGGTFANKTFIGAMPRECQRVEWFFGPTKQITGSPASDSEVEMWLLQYVK